MTNGLWYPHRHWINVFPGNATFTSNSFDYINARTAFFTYALAWGVNEGLLEQGRYDSAVRRGWAALVRAVQPNGRLGYVQRPGDRPAGAEPDHTEPYGTGAFLLAGSEVYRRAVRAGQ